MHIKKHGVIKDSKNLSYNNIIIRRVSQLGLAICCCHVTVAMVVDSSVAVSEWLLGWGYDGGGCGCGFPSE